MNPATRIELEKFLHRFGMRNVSIKSILGGMVFISAYMGGEDIEAIYNISESTIVYRTYDEDFEAWNKWQEV